MLRAKGLVETGTKQARVARLVEHRHAADAAFLAAKARAAGKSAASERID